MKFLRLNRAALLLVVLITAACTGFPPVSTGHVSSQYTQYAADADMPVFENRHETEHFVLKWTNRSSNSRNNIKDQQIIKDTGGYLEQAYAKYVELFGRKPFTAPGKEKIEVVFWDIDCFGIADPPAGPIQLNAASWVRDPGIRQPTSAHELFHKMQYAYGYKTKWNPREPFMWFTEGTAAWSEVFVWGRVSRTCKVDQIFKDTKMDIYAAEDMAMPFWIYFVQGNQERPNHQLMVKLLERCEQVRDEKRALNDIIKENYGSVDNFYRNFAKTRTQGFWTETCEAPYRCILGPDGNDLVEKVKNIQKKAASRRS